MPTEVGEGAGGGPSASFCPKWPLPGGAGQSEAVSDFTRGDGAGRRESVTAGS